MRPTYNINKLQFSEGDLLSCETAPVSQLLNVVNWKAREQRWRESKERQVAVWLLLRGRQLTRVDPCSQGPSGGCAEGSRHRERGAV